MDFACKYKEIHTYYWSRGQREGREGRVLGRHTCTHTHRKRIYNMHWG